MRNSSCAELGGAGLGCAELGLAELLSQECAARGEDYERVKLLEVSAEDAERWERKRKKKNPDLGFSGDIKNCIKFILNAIKYIK